MNLLFFTYIIPLLFATFILSKLLDLASDARMKKRISFSEPLFQFGIIEQF